MLRPGDSVNFVSAVLLHENLLVLETITDCKILMLSREDLLDIASEDSILRDNILLLQTKYKFTGVKYDYSVYDPKAGLIEKTFTPKRSSRRTS